MDGLSLYDHEGAEIGSIPFDQNFFAHPDQVLSQLQAHRADALDYRTVAIQYLQQGDLRHFKQCLQAGIRIYPLVSICC